MDALETGTTGQPPRVSVVIPHLNEPQVLKRCLMALTRQQPGTPPFEIIVADNGSDNPPEALCRQFANTRLTVERTPGPGPARNAGARLARGDIIGFIDCDCFAAPDWIKRVVACFDRSRQVDFIAGRIDIAPARGRMNGVEAYEAVFSYRVRMFVKRDSFAATGNMAVRRSVFDAVGPFDGIAQHEDKLWGQKAVAQGFSLAYLHEAVVATPGCQTLAELAVRMERHVAHDFIAHPLTPAGKLRWLARSALVAGSTIIAAPAIILSRDVKGVGIKLSALYCLAWIRLYRAWLMVNALRQDWALDHLATWNRDKPGSRHTS